MKFTMDDSYLGAYEFIFSRNDYKSPWRYNSFVRQTNFPIPEQKEKIKQMLAIKFDELILDVVKNDLVQDELNFIAEFKVTKDSLEINNIAYF